MADMSIRGMDDEVREKLRVRAASHGRSMEAEIRKILVDAVNEPASSEGLFTALLDRFADIDGVDLELPHRMDSGRTADLFR